MGKLRVRIKQTPRERELDGIRLDLFRPGALHEVSSTLAAWLIAEGYADIEMRKQAMFETFESLDEERTYQGPEPFIEMAADRRRRTDKS